MEINKNKNIIEDILKKYNLDLPDKIPRKPRINKEKVIILLIFHFHYRNFFYNLHIMISIYYVYLHHFL